jgi:hypothetical protein
MWASALSSPTLCRYWDTGSSGVPGTSYGTNRFFSFISLGGKKRRGEGAKNFKFDKPWIKLEIPTLIIGNLLSSLLFFGGQRKVTKETRPAIAESPLNRMVSVARAKTR